MFQIKLKSVRESLHLSYVTSKRTKAEKPHLKIEQMKNEKDKN